MSEGDERELAAEILSERSEFERIFRPYFWIFRVTSLRSRFCREILTKSMIPEIQGEGGGSLNPRSRKTRDVGHAAN
jgi:hypothetical protein